MGLECFPPSMVLLFLENGRMTYIINMGLIFIPMVKGTKGKYLMVWKKGMVPCIILMATFTQGNGHKIVKRGMDS